MADIQVKKQKVIRVGNSVALTLDSAFLQNQKLEVGDSLIVRYTDDGIVTIFSPKALEELTETEAISDTEKVKQANSKITPELIEWTKQFIQENKSALKELANL